MKYLLDLPWRELPNSLREKLPVDGDDRPLGKIRHRPLYPWRPVCFPWLP